MHPLAIAAAFVAGWFVGVSDERLAERERALFRRLDALIADLRRARHS